jgi:exodeoxyribonuclease V gamma subunit
VLHVHHADRADALVGALAEVLREPPDDPFAPEVVAVHSRGIERWIAQRLSHHLGTSPGRGDGVAANVRFPFPGALVGDAVARATGTDPARDPWRPDRLVWPLLDVVDAAVRERRDDLLGPLRPHVADADGTPSDRRLGAVRRVAELFDRYAVHRPAMLTAWAAGEDRGGDGGPLPDRWRWQPALWRAVRDRLGTRSTAERLTEATDAIAHGRTVDGAPLELDLPARLAVFGVTSLSATSVEVLAALADGEAGRDVHLLLLHPSPTLWRRVSDATGRTADAPTVAATGRTALPRREDDPTAALPRDPLLAAWGRDARELQLVAGSVPATHHDLAGAQPAAAPTTLLARLQTAVRDDQARHEGDDLPALGGDDRSLQVHRCHGPTRQVEVLRDVLLHLLADDPSLEPRDVVVLCPDIETFAPLIEAVFGAEHVVPEGADGDEDGVPRLRVQLADRSLRRTNPLLRVAAELLDLADGRVTASDVVDLCTRAPVRRRFELDEDDLGQLDTWLTSTGVRWGLDADHRDDRGVPTDANTWRTGLDRLLTGVAVADERLRTTLGVTPEDDVEGDGVELAGRVAELLARLDAAVRTMRNPRPVGAWLDVLTEAVGQLCEVDPSESWQEVQLGRAFAEVRDAVRDTAAETARLPLSLHEVRGLLADRLAGAPSRAAHRTGDLTVCTLVPMRSVPHRVVVLLGMDDEVFPRRTVPDGDDLLVAAPVVGDRDPRTEDRQLLLDALLAAGDHLVVLTTGRDGRTGEAARRRRPHRPCRSADGRPVPPSTAVDAIVAAPRRPRLPAPPRAGAAPSSGCRSPSPDGSDVLDDASRSSSRASRPTGRATACWTRCGRPDLDRCVEVERARGTLPPGELATRRSRRSAAPSSSWSRARASSASSSARPRGRRDRRPAARRHAAGRRGRRRGRRRPALGHLLPLGPRPRLPAWVDLLALYAHTRPDRGRRSPSASARHEGPGRQDPAW